jgi:hypothetical protein
VRRQADDAFGPPGLHESSGSRRPRRDETGSRQRAVAHPPSRQGQRPVQVCRRLNPERDIQPRRCSSPLESRHGKRLLLEEDHVRLMVPQHPRRPEAIDVALGGPCEAHRTGFEGRFEPFERFGPELALAVRVTPSVRDHHRDIPPTLPQIPVDGLVHREHAWVADDENAHIHRPQPFATAGSAGSEPNSGTSAPTSSNVPVATIRPLFK